MQTIVMEATGLEEGNERASKTLSNLWQAAPAM